MTQGSVQVYAGNLFELQVLKNLCKSGPSIAPQICKLWVLLLRGEFTNLYFVKSRFIHIQSLVFFCFHSVFAKITVKIHGSKPLFSFLLSSTYHCNKVRKCFTKQGKSTYRNLFYDNSFDQF